MDRYELPADVSRCDGRTKYASTATVITELHDQCVSCLRRTSRIDHPQQSWFYDPPEFSDNGQCPYRAAPRDEAPA